MAAAQTVEPARSSRGGRPRDPSRDGVIRAAILRLLAEVGYGALTMDAVAAEAGVGKATIYRRWRTKQDLVVDGRRLPAVAWSYEDPSPGYEHLRGAVAFYPGAVDRALVDGEPAQPQPGGFYGGWVTDEVTGPFKGEPGTSWW